MAENNQNNEVRNFDGSLNTGVNDYHSKKNSWTFALNACPNSKSGDAGDLGNSPSNILAVKAPYTIIGFIYLFADNWAVFSTNDVDSEIGRFIESTSTYTTVVNDSYYPAGTRRLNFNRANLIIGVSKENFDCTWHIYWSDGNNPDRQMNMDKPQFVQNCTTTSGCTTCVNLVIPAPVPYSGFVIDTDAIRLAKLVNAPCLRVIKGATGGSLFNGSYFVVAAYMINGQKVTDFFTPSNVQALFEHSNVAGSIDIIIDSMDTRFDEFELVVVSIVNQQTSAKRFGVYDTRQKQITIDIIDPKLPDVPLSQIPIHNPIADKSDAMFTVGNYLVRKGPTNKFDFNYQPLANQIVTMWQSVEYPADYYRKGGTKTSRLRDENYCEFIQWIYDDGDLSSSYHIPGRPAITFPAGSGVLSGLKDTDPLGGSGDSLDPSDRVFEVYNTATAVGVSPFTPTDDGGFVIQEGLMGYWESTELYPDDKPEVYNASANTWSAIGSTTILGTPLPIPYAATGTSDYDLCGKPIRHHKFPEQALRTQPSVTTTQHFVSSALSPGLNGVPAIRILGTAYKNILPPVDNSGNRIPGIVGYRILRGSREGNKTVVAKGMLNNMFQYNIEGGITTRTGLYPNYPYNDVRPDQFISLIDTFEIPSIRQTIGIPNPNVDPNTVTFHSPDTSFRNPFLSMKELKVYGQLSGDVHGNFVEPNKHPRHKFITDAAFIFSAVAGVGIAVVSMNGDRTTTQLLPRKSDFVDMGAQFGTPDTGTWGLLNGSAAFLTAAAGTEAALNAGLAALDLAWSADQLLSNALGITTTVGGAAFDVAADAAAILPGMSGFSNQVTQANGALDNTPPLLTAFNLIPSLSYYWSQGTDATLALINAMIRWEQHALQYQSHCLYDSWLNSNPGSTRRTIGDEIYLDGQIQDFGTSLRINNLFRGKTVAVQTTSGFPLPVGDTSKQTIATAVGSGLISDYKHTSVLVPFRTRAASHYAAMKNRLRNQYGQLGGVQQIPINSCTIDTTSGAFPFTSPVLFGGDTYVSRYTEKNTMFFFYDWLYGQPDGYEFNYHLKKMVPYPKYWMDTQRFDVSDFVSSITANPFSPGSWVFPDKLHAFDRDGSGWTLGNPVSLFGVHDAYVYLSNSGVRDFYVESDVNTDLRDWGDNVVQRHYDPYRYTDEKAMFDMNPDVIKAGNYFKYDYSLSISKLFPQFVSWANIQPINYDPSVYATCYVHNPNLVIYSLQSTDVTSQQAQLIRDNWLVFLANNYKYFQNPVTSITPINKSGALFLFEAQSPQQILGVDTLRLGSGVDATVGTGALFSQPLQNLMTADQSYEYGSCQNRLSAINTPAGIFWISQSIGKIFQYQLGGGIKELSAGVDEKWWFAQYLPYKLTLDFPTFELVDNPVIGIGCQSIYDNENALVYFMKRDYKLRTDLPTGTAVVYVSKDDFMVNGILPIKLGDPVYFEDASWTISWDAKTQGWVSYHDWHSELCLPGKNTFLTTQTDKSTGEGGVWLHNETALSYCNFYGKDYPFEVAYRVDTVQQTTTLRSVEHQVEFYKYAPNEHDRYLFLEEYFDEAVVYNQEQVSGLLKLVQKPINDPWAELAYPITNPSSTSILYSKVEGKYRWNMVNDLTDDRGEFTNARRTIWLTPANGYTRVLNPVNVNYSKDDFQRKKIRGYNTEVLLRKKVSGSTKILVILVNNKLLNSPR